MNTQPTLNEHPAAAEPAAVQQSAPPNDPAPKTASKDETRCEHLFPNHTRCRLQASAANPRFCPRHAKLPENLQPPNVTSELFGNPVKMEELDDIYDFLTNLLYLLSENRISTRRAAVLAYISNQLFRTLTAIERKEAEATPQFVFDAPRPKPD